MSDIPLLRSEPTTLYAPRSTHAFGSSHAFVIPLAPASDGEASARLPGCVHLAGAGEVRYELEAVLRVAHGAGAQSQNGGNIEEVREVQVVHLTPCAGDGDAAEGLGAPRPTVATRTMSKDGQTTRMRLLVANTRTHIGEALPVGVEIGAAPGEEAEPSSAGDADTTPAPDPRALRRVKLELYRRVRTPSLSPAEAGQSTSSSSVASAAPAPPAWTAHTFLLWRSGKSCRFSPRQPIRLMFHLPPHASVHPMVLPGAAARGAAEGGSGSGAGDTIACGEMTQETPYHEVTFFVRAIAGYATGDGPGRADVDLVLDQELEVLAPRWPLAGDAVPPDSAGTPPAHLAADAALAQQLSYDEDDLPDSAEARNEAYRRKGTDVVGAGGTYRPEFPDVVQGASSGSGSTPLRTPYHGATAGADPPPFSAEALPPPFAAVAGGSRDAAHEVHQDPPPLGAASGADLPTFQESQSHGPVQPTSRLDAVPQPQFTVVPATGELASWIEYDGYESFSQPPPPATASLGLSGSMDPPPAGEDVNAIVDSAVVRELLDAGPGTSGVEDRIRLMTELGLGDGTRVVDTREDMPPGIDEPSLPALPDMSRRHSMSQDADVGVDVAAIAARNGQAIGASPPSFAASERAEAGADHPPPLYSTSRADAPPSYR